MEREIWKDIGGTEFHQISNMGRIRSKTHRAIVKVGKYKDTKRVIIGRVKRFDTKEEAQKAYTNFVNKEYEERIKP